MQQVLAGLNPEDGSDHIAVYFDDILIFSKNLTEHMKHLCQVFERLENVGFKLNPKKCCFACPQVQHLGHVITSDGLKPSEACVEAVKQFRVPQDVSTLHKFLGVASFYRRFVPNFAQIASPLHDLTRKGASLDWTEACQTSFDLLRNKLVEAPVLAYPNFENDLTLEMDASGNGLGAILSQTQEDGRLHPVAYTSRPLSLQKKKYAITELETLAEAWAMSHFHHYLMAMISPK